MARPLSVWLLKIGEHLPVKKDAKKMRSILLAEELVKRGHKVTWWTSAFDHFSKTWVFDKDTEFSADGYDVIALKGRGYKSNISLARFADHRIIAKKFSKAAEGKPKPDIILAAMPAYDLSCAAVNYGKKHNVPVIVDLRDQWPDIFLEHIPAFARPLARLALAPDFNMLKTSVKGAAALCGMMDSILDWGLKYAGRGKTEWDRVFLLGHEASSDYEETPRMQELKSKVNGRFTVTFIGTFASYHNPSVLAETAKLLKDKDICFVLAGTGPHFEEIKKNAQGLPNFFLPGWLNQKEINALLRFSSIGMCTSNMTAEFFPNKAFLYMSAGLPVISAFYGDFKKIAETEGFGFHYPPNDAKTLAKLILSLYEDRELHRRMAEKSKAVFLEKFDARRIYPEFAEYIENLAEHLRGKN